MEKVAYVEICNHLNDSNFGFRNPYYQVFLIRSKLLCRVITNYKFSVRIAEIWKH